MTRELRARHRILVAGVAVVAGGLGLAGLVSRREVPRVDLPPALVAQDATPLSFDSPQVHGALGRLAQGGVGVTLALGEPAAGTALAAYWSPGAPRETLPADAAWLGRVDSRAERTFLLPVDSGGSVVLYDLTGGRIVAAARLAPAGARP